MTKVRKKRFGATKNEYLYDFYEKLLNYKEKLDTFISESQSILTGGGYDALRKVISYYIEVIDYAANLYLYTYNSFNAANAEMYEFMGPYDVLNDKDLNDIRATYNKAKDDLNDISAGLLSTRSIDDILDKLQNLPPLIDKLENLAPTDNRLANSLNDTKSKANSFSRYIRSIKVIQVDEFIG